MSDSVSPGHAAAATDEAGSWVPPGVGARLRLARELRQMSVNDVAQALKLGPRQVQALENGNWQALPGQTFVRGFVRNYARLLQIDPTPLMDQLDDTLDKPADSLNVPQGRPTTMPRGQKHRDRNVILAGLVIVLLAMLAYLLLANDLSALRERAQGLIDSLSHKEPGPAPAASSPAAAPTAASEPVFPPGSTQHQVMHPQDQAPAEMAPAQLVAPALGAANAAAGEPLLRVVFIGKAKVEVRDRDDKVVFSQRGAAGSEKTIDGEMPLSLVIRNAPGVKLFWRGQAIDLGPHTKGEVARLVLE
ncbi:MAG: helix-turn-helix domain-containing protein [Dechloromonas sp.]|nr:helix-turn-helix domain-containing protein [Dechloromonas sp.]